MITALITLAVFALFVAGMLHEARSLESADADDITPPDRHPEPQ